MGTSYMRFRIFKKAILKIFDIQIYSDFPLLSDSEALICVIDAYDSYNTFIHSYAKPCKRKVMEELDKFIENNPRYLIFESNGAFFDN